MSERTKKILFGVGFALVSIGLGYLLFFMFFRSQTPTSSPTPTPTLGGRLPTAGVGGPTSTPTGEGPGSLPTTPTPPPSTATPSANTRTQLLRDGVTQNISPSPDGNGARFYNPDDGRFYRADADGTITLLGEKQFFNLKSVSWGNRSDQAILDFPDGSNIFYDFTTKIQTTLPKHWEDFTFSPGDTRVSAKSIGIDPENRFLIETNPNGTEARAIEPLGDNGNLVKTAWSPSEQIIAYAKTGEPQSNHFQEILFVGKNHENFRSLIAPGQDFLPSWSPSGKTLLFSVYHPDTENKPSLWLASGEAGTIGTNRKSLNIATWADKCAWASDNQIYCAVPKNLPANAGLSRRDFATLPDDIFRIDINAGTFTKINTPDQTRPVRKPVLSKDGTKLLFSDAETGRLYSYTIK
jgi:hypothetical protein